MLKYLGTDEGEAREHMERAIATVLQFSEQVSPSGGSGRIVHDHTTRGSNIFSVNLWERSVEYRAAMGPGML